MRFLVKSFFTVVYSFSEKFLSRAIKNSNRFGTKLFQRGVGCCDILFLFSWNVSITRSHIQSKRRGRHSIPEGVGCERIQNCISQFYLLLGHKLVWRQPHLFTALREERETSQHLTSRNFYSVGPTTIMEEGRFPLSPRFTQ